MKRSFRFRTAVGAALCGAAVVCAEPRAELHFRGYVLDADSRNDTAVGEQSDLRAGGETALGDTLSLFLFMRLTDRWDSRDEEYIRARLDTAAAAFAEPFFLPLKATLGRQYAHLEPGFLFSGLDDRWLFDGIRVESDRFPWRVSGLAADVSSAGFRSPVDRFAWIQFMHSGRPGRFPEMYAGGGRFENDTRNFETLYAGADFRTRPGLRFRAHAAHQTDRAEPELSAWSAAASAAKETVFSAHDRAVVRWHFASGDENPERNFIPLFDEDDSGVVFHPDPINRHSAALEYTVTAGPWSAGLSGYAHWQDAIAPISYDTLESRYPPLNLRADGVHRHLGNEVAIALERTWDNRYQIRGGAGLFFPGDAAGASLSKDRIWGARLEFSTTW